MLIHDSDQMIEIYAAGNLTLRRGDKQRSPNMLLKSSSFTAPAEGSALAVEMETLGKLLLGHHQRTERVCPILPLASFLAALRKNCTWENMAYTPHDLLQPEKSSRKNQEKKPARKSKRALPKTCQGWKQRIYQRTGI